MKPFTIFLFTYIFFQQATAQCWNLVWKDEFKGSALNSSKWSASDDPMTYSAEEEYYTSRSQNVSVVNNKLQLTALHEMFSGKNYTSGKIISKEKFSFSYGKIEARMKLPTGKGCWPAFWLLPQDLYYGSWPESGGIDIMEMISQNPSTLYSTIHCTDVDNGTHGSTQSSATLSSGKFSDGYHVFTCEWDPDQFRFYLDGVLFGTKNKTSYPNFNWPFDRPFYIILNLAIGGGWAEPADPNDYPQTMYVDYVKVYQLNNQLAITGNNLAQPDVKASYSLPSISGATYNWSVSGGGTIASGGTGSTVKLTGILLQEAEPFRRQLPLPVVILLSLFP
ncbi:MAG: glycoside hydrolase family 16 protein [Chitinophagales bacterium]|nr:glycoside hydrolase family 16 protein [Chitinophagales bacterium]